METQRENNQPPSPQAAEEAWYWQRGGERIGPLGKDALSALAKVGELKADDLVCFASCGEWTTASQVPGLIRPPPPLTAVSDALPLWILAGLVLCFLVYFSHATPLVSLEAKGLRGVDGEQSAEPFAAQAAGEDTYSVEICNNTEEVRLYAAVAYFDPLRHDWVTRGWFAEDHGACQVAIKNLREPIYVYAETKDGGSRWSDDGGREFCLADRGAFSLAQGGCHDVSGAALRRQKFKLLKVNGRGGLHTWDLTE